MAKFLIQDIIPPEKKKHLSTKHVGAEHPHTPHHAHKTGDVEEVKPAAHHTRTPLHKAAATHHKRGAHEESQHAEEVHDAPTTEESQSVTPERDPRSMIADQLEEDHVHAKKIANAILENSTPISSFPETASTWPYTKSPEVAHLPYATSNETAHTIPPQFGATGLANEEGGYRWLPWLIGVVLAAILGFLALNFFGGGTIFIIAKHESIPLDQKFSSLKNPQNGELAFVVMSATTTLTREVPATGTKTVTAKASGKIIVYNEQLTAQRLIKNTRFESPSGKIYRINDSITVPKATTPKGKSTLVPGAFEVTIYADEAGPDYNTDPVDFSIPGLKATPQYKKVYARAKGAITGGASGTIKSVSDQDLKQASDDLRVQLETKLRNEARGKLTPSQIAYDPSIVVELSDPELSAAKASSDDKAIVSESGSISMVLFDRMALTKTITKALVPTYGEEDVSISNLDQLTMTMEPMSGEALREADTLTVNLKGTPDIKWNVDEVAITKALLGSPKASFNSLMTQYPMIERAKATLSPFWKNTFPTDPKKITVKIVDTIQ